MADLKGMTVRALRDLARKHLGPGYSRLRTKSELLSALAKVLPRPLQQALEPEQPQPQAAPPAPEAVSPHAKAPAAPAPCDTAAVQTEPDPEGHLVARVAGETSAHQAEIPLVEEKVPPHATAAPGADTEEQLGELPDGYGEDAVVLLPKDPRSLYLFWDFAPETVARAFDGMAGLHTKLRLFADNHLVREVDFALDSRSWYLHGLDSGRAYRAELVSVSSDGQVRRIGPPSNTLRLPPDGPSAIIDDRFARIPFDLPAGRLAEAIRGRPSAPAAPFAEESRGRIFEMSRGATPLGASEQRPGAAGAEGEQVAGGPPGAAGPSRPPGAPSSDTRAWSGTFPRRSS